METRITSVQTKKSLSVVEFITSNIDTFDYISLSSAAKKNLIELKEINEGGSVNDVFVINRSDKFVFIMDGDIIQGAKQNRIINTSILLAPMSKAQIQVSCVEQGRWQKVSNSFHVSDDFFAPSILRYTKSRDVFDNLKKGRSHYANQSNVWDTVSQKLDQYNVASNTSNLGDIMNEKKEQFKVIEEEFNCGENVNGLAIFKENQFLGLDLFNSSQVYKDYFYKIVKGVAFDINYLKSPKGKIDENELKYKTLEMIDQIESLDMHRFKGVGVGVEDRFETEKYTGFKLNYENNLIHMAVMSINQEAV